jgi:hypothetical protein
MEWGDLIADTTINILVEDECGDAIFSIQLFYHGFAGRRLR